MNKAAKDAKKEILYYTPEQVALHNAPEDLWVSFLGHVYNLSPLALQYENSPLLGPILRAGGSDISHWFDPATGDLLMQTNPLTGCKTPYTPDGRFLHVPPPLPRSDWNPCELDQTPWWLEHSKYRIGTLSTKTRKVIIVNTLTQQSCTLTVCGEEAIIAIQDRYLAYNSHAKGYMWKRQGTLLDMNATLEENGMPDQAKQFERAGMNEDEWLPVIHLYFRYARVFTFHFISSDDLTIA
ncbi:MAG: hypothetical protein SGCHY_005533 [Lobulomycetales sp.]